MLKLNIWILWLFFERFKDTALCWFRSNWVIIFIERSWMNDNRAMIQFCYLRDHGWMIIQLWLIPTIWEQFRCKLCLLRLIKEMWKFCIYTAIMTKWLDYLCLLIIKPGLDSRLSSRKFLNAFPFTGLWKSLFTSSNDYSILPSLCRDISKSPSVLSRPYRNTASSEFFSATFKEKTSLILVFEIVHKIWIMYTYKVP